MLSNKTPLRHRYAMPPLPKERLSCILRTIQNLQSYELCGILDIEKTTAHRGGLPSRLRKIRSVLVKVLGRFFYVRNFFTFCSEK